MSYQMKESMPFINCITTHNPKFTEDDLATNFKKELFFIFAPVPPPLLPETLVKPPSKPVPIEKADVVLFPHISFV